MLTVIGEGLVDVVQRSSGVQAHVGGSPLNVAVGLARLDHPVQFIGRYGRDPYGEALAAHLKSSSVLLPVGPDELPTSVAAALIDDAGAATYTFDLAWELPGVAARLPFLLQGTTLLHTGSIATMLAPGAAEVLAAVERAHPSATISFDPNCRPSIIPDVDYARAQAEKFVTLADVVKASDEDLEWLYPGADPLDSARRWLGLGGSEGPAMVVVTRGGQGPWGINAAGVAQFAAPPSVGRGHRRGGGFVHGRAAVRGGGPGPGRGTKPQGPARTLRRKPPRPPRPCLPGRRRHRVPRRRQPAHARRAGPDGGW